MAGGRRAGGRTSRSTLLLLLSGEAPFLSSSLDQQAREGKAAVLREVLVADVEGRARFARGPLLESDHRRPADVDLGGK